MQVHSKFARTNTRESACGHLADVRKVKVKLLPVACLYTSEGRKSEKCMCALLCVYHI
jgi:hypothetical protein